MSPGVLVAGIGNIFLSDDGFGVEVANRLAAVPMPAGVRVADFGVRGVHLAYELLDGYDRLILVDAVPMGEAPGTLAVIQPDAAGVPGTAGVPGADGDIPVVDAHSMGPDVVLATLSRLGGSVEEIYIVGCQPASLDEGIGLTPSVASAVEDAMDLCRQLADGPVQPELFAEARQPAPVAVTTQPFGKATS
jgi:hydrogenase maturation protease